LGDLVFIDVAQKKKAVSVQAAWDAYCAARARAEATQKIEDGIAAGQAWRQWLELFQRAS
jgi:hypothetical protein